MRSNIDPAPPPAQPPLRLVQLRLDGCTRERMAQSDASGPRRSISTSAHSVRLDRVGCTGLDGLAFGAAGERGVLAGDQRQVADDTERRQAVAVAAHSVTSTGCCAHASTTGAIFPATVTATSGPPSAHASGALQSIGQERIGRAPPYCRRRPASFACRRVRRSPSSRAWSTNRRATGLNIRPLSVTIATANGGASSTTGRRRIASRPA